MVYMVFTLSMLRTCCSPLEDASLPAVVDRMRRQFRDVVSNCSHCICTFSQQNRDLTERLNTFCLRSTELKRIQNTVKDLLTELINAKLSLQQPRDQIKAIKPQVQSALPNESAANGSCCSETAMNALLRQQLLENNLKILEEKLNVERMARTQQLSDAEHKLLAENAQLQVALKSTQRRLQKETELRVSYEKRLLQREQQERQQLSNVEMVHGADNVDAVEHDMENVVLKQQILALVGEKHATFAKIRELEDSNSTLASENQRLTEQLSRTATIGVSSPAFDSLVDGCVKRHVMMSSAIIPSQKLVDSLLKSAEKLNAFVNRVAKLILHLRNETQQLGDANIQLRKLLTEIQQFERPMDELARAVHCHNLDDSLSEQTGVHSIDCLPNFAKVGERERCRTELEINLRCSEQKCQFFQERYEKTATQYEKLRCDIVKKTQLIEQLSFENVEYEMQFKIIQQQLIAARSQLKQTTSQLTAAQLLCKLTKNQLLLVQKSVLQVSSSVIPEHSASSHVLNEVQSLQVELENCQEAVDVLVCENAELKVKLRHIEDQARLDRAVLCHTVTTKLAVEQQLQIVASERDALEVLRHNLEAESLTQQMNNKKLSQLIDHLQHRNAQRC